MSEKSIDDAMGALLLQKVRGAIEPLTKELYTLFNSMGCEPHCHFCLEPLNVGDLFGFKRIKPGASGTACKRCIDIDRPAPQVAMVDADERQEAERGRLQGSTPQLPMPKRPGFILFEESP